MLERSQYIWNWRVKLKVFWKQDFKLTKVEVEILKKEVKDESSESLSETRTDPLDVLEPVADKVGLSGSYTLQRNFVVSEEAGLSKEN